MFFFSGSTYFAAVDTTNISPPYYFKYWLPFCKGSIILECNHLSLSLEINSIKAWKGKQDEELSFCVPRYLLKLQNIFFSLFLLIASHRPVIICVVSTEWGPWVNINALLVSFSLFPLKTFCESLFFPSMCLFSGWNVCLGLPFCKIPNLISIFVSSCFANPAFFFCIYLIRLSVCKVVPSNQPGRSGPRSLNPDPAASCPQQKVISLYHLPQKRREKRKRKDITAQGNVCSYLALEKQCSSLRVNKIKLYILRCKRNIFVEH